jgi:hypothetical protein
MGGMEIAALVLEYVKALAWPLVVLGLALMFRAELRDLVDRIRTFKGMGFEAQIAEKLSRVAAKAEKIEKASGLNTSKRVEERSIGESPLERLLGAWREVEVLAYEIGRARGAAHSVKNVGQLVRELHRDGLVTDDLVEIARGLQGIRNDIVHRQEGISLLGGSVDSFIDLTHTLRDALEGVLKKVQKNVS